MYHRSYKTVQELLHTLNVLRKHLDKRNKQGPVSKRRFSTTDVKPF